MNGAELLFDTNAFIAWAAEDRALAREVASVQVMALSVISLGELMLGAKKSARAERNLEDLRLRLVDFRLVQLDGETATFYADVALALRRKGRPIPVNDIWIAAAALRHELPVLTRDAHFHEVPGLTVVSW